MGETKETNQEVLPIPFPLIAAAYLLFFCLECILAVEVRSVAFFSDSIVFLEGASVSVLMWPRLNWSLPGREAFARFTRTVILIPTCFMFWMIAANYYGAETPSGMPMALVGGVLLLTNVVCLNVVSPAMFEHQPASRTHVRSHAIKNAAIILAGFLTWASGMMWPDVLVGVGILCVNADAGERIEFAARSPHARAA